MYLVAAFAALSVCGAGIASSQTLSLDDQAAMGMGESVTFTLLIDYPSSGSGEIRSVTINVSFDHTVLTYDGHARGSLVSGWPVFDVSNSQDGQLTVAGLTFTSGNGLQPGDSGAIVELQFTVDAMRDTTLAISAQDDLAAFATKAGQFTFELPPSNNPPVAMDDMGTTQQDQSVVIDVLANDEDADGESLSVTAVTQGDDGGVAVTAGGATVTYTPNTGFTGSDAFTYTVSDGTDSDTGMVTVTVTEPPRPPNNAPVAMDDTAQTDEDQAVVVHVLDNDTDADGDTLAVTMATDPSDGTVAITDNDTAITYTPDAGYSGEDQFMYTVSDGEAADTATVYVDVDAEEVVAPATGGDSSGGGGGCALTPGARFDPTLVGFLAILLAIRLVRQCARRRGSLR